MPIEGSIKKAAENEDQNDEADHKEEQDQKKSSE